MGKARLPEVKSDNQTALIEVPLGEAPLEQEYARSQIHVELDKAQSLMLERMFRGLNGNNRRLANGRHVTYSADVIRYILDNCQIPGISLK